ncbi:MAG TPA: phosphoglucomutase, partial [Eggerthellaceae bacterium]|nr:phosphoglucomutase [Eggerthellaceae bacterium]
APLKLVYTPLNGTGLECVSRILERVGISDVTVVPEQAQPDGNFPTCPYPNPEIREALQKGIDLAEEVHPDLLVATDPDADRVGIACKDGDDYLLLSGNETGVLLLDYVARMISEAKGADEMKRKIAVTTIVSSVMVDAIAAAYGFEVRRVLTGFKYIGGVIAELESAGEADRFMFGFEESYGYLNGTHVRDKDAVDASMLICQMAQYYKARGMNLADAMRALYEEHGYYLNKTLSFSFPGIEGGQKMSSLMQGLRSDAPNQIAGLQVVDVVDYASGIDGLPPANVVAFALEGENKLIVRPSGTEPKVKAYLFAKGATRADAEQLLASLESAANDIMA